MKKGYKQTKEHTEKSMKGLIKVRHKTWFKKGHKLVGGGNTGHISVWRGKKRPNQSGKKHYCWKGGITRNRHFCSRPEYKQWRMNVYLRDNFTCQYCGIKGVYLEAHHIKRWVDYPELRYDINNGVTLCKECHKLANNYRGK